MTGSDGVTAMPDLGFEYTQVSLAAEGQVTAMTTPPGRSTSDKDVTLADLNGDSLPDLLVGKAGAFISYVNQDGTAWQAESDWATSDSPSVSLSTTGVQLADMDGDGAVDLVIKSGTDDFRYLPGVDAQHFGAAVSITTVPNFTFEDPDVRMADMDGDRRTDVVITTASGLAIGYNLNGTDWTVPQTIGVVDEAQTLRFSDGHTQLCDVNGDRVQDLCHLTSGSLIYYLGRGRGISRPLDRQPESQTSMCPAPGNCSTSMATVGSTWFTWALTRWTLQWPHLPELSARKAASLEHRLSFRQRRSSLPT